MACDTAVTTVNTCTIDQNIDTDIGKNSECDVACNKGVTPESMYTIDQNTDSDNGKNPECDVVDDGKNSRREAVSDTITIIDDDGDNDTSDYMQVAEICTRKGVG